MESVIGIIFGNNCSNLLGGLAQDRPIAAIPFGGKYRILDFALSSMVNSGIRTVGLIAPQHYRPLVGYLGAGKDWFLDRKKGGLFILPGTIHGLLGNQSKFEIKDIGQNIEFLQKDNSDNVVICYCNQVFNINYRESLDFHIQKDADITLFYKKSNNPCEINGRLGLTMGEDQKVRIFREYRERGELEEPTPYFVDMMIIKRKLFLEIVESYQFIEGIDLMDVIIDNHKVLKVFSFDCQSYIGRIDSLKCYFDRNMDLFNPDVKQELFQGGNVIYTKKLDTPPTKYASNPTVKNSLLAGGCMIEGHIENSILSRDVVVKKGAQIKNSIIMDKCILNEDVVLENVILDKFVEVNKGNVIKANPSQPLVVAKRSVI